MTPRDIIKANIECRCDDRIGFDFDGGRRNDFAGAGVARRLAAFCAEPNALVFGCAGLRSLLDAPLPVAPGTLVGFMFGELVTLDGRPQFGNLMAARLVRKA